MERVANYWRGVPAGSKVAIVTLIGGWALHAAAYLHFFPADLTDRNVFLQLIVGVGICYGVAAGRKWARMLCVFFNIGIVALYALFSMALVQSEEILRQGREEAGKILGRAEKDAAVIYARAHQMDPEFYVFWRSLQAIRKTLGAKTTIIMRNDEGPFKSLFELPQSQQSGVPTPAAVPSNSPPGSSAGRAP